MKTLKYLISKGADVNAKDNKGTTLLHVAANCDVRSVAFLEYLLNAGADVHAKNNKGETPLDIASSEAKKRVLREWM